MPHITKEQENRIRDEFRKQFDELGLKPPKKSMKNLERELILYYWIEKINSILSLHNQELIEKIRGIVEEICQDSSYDNMVFSLSSGREEGTKKVLERYDELTKSLIKE